MNNNLLSILPFLLGMQKGADNNATETLLKLMLDQKSEPTVFPSFGDASKSNSGNGMDPMMMALLAMMLKNGGNQNFLDFFNAQKTSNDTEKQNISATESETVFQQDENNIDKKKGYDFKEINDFSGQEIIESLKVMTDRSLP